MLSVWLEHYPDDFRTPPDYTCLQVLEKWARQLPAQMGNGIVGKVQGLMNGWKQADAEGVPGE